MLASITYALARVLLTEHEHRCHLANLSCAFNFILCIFTKEFCRKIDRKPIKHTTSVMHFVTISSVLQSCSPFQTVHWPADSL